tara:strand:- start:3462 stop:6008 length:2547 start_codon:yes stop_codon:yes gene_type:complete
MSLLYKYVRSAVEADNLEFLMLEGHMQIINVTNNPGDKSFLNWAILKKQPEVLRWLVNNGADIQNVSEGRDALEYAMDCNFCEGVQVLLECGVDPNRFTNSGLTLIQSCLLKDFDRAKKLMELPTVDVNKLSKDGRTTFEILLSARKIFDQDVRDEIMKAIKKFCEDKDEDNENKQILLFDKICLEFNNGDTSDSMICDIFYIFFGYVPSDMIDERQILLRKFLRTNKIRELCNHKNNSTGLTVIEALSYNRYDYNSSWFFIGYESLIKSDIYHFHDTVMSIMKNLVPEISQEIKNYYIENETITYFSTSMTNRDIKLKKLYYLLEIFKINKNLIEPSFFKSLIEGEILLVNINLNNSFTSIMSKLSSIPNYFEIVLKEDFNPEYSCCNLLNNILASSISLNTKNKINFIYIIFKNLYENNKEKLNDLILSEKSQCLGKKIEYIKKTKGCGCGHCRPPEEEKITKIIGKPHINFMDYLMKISIRNIEDSKIMEKLNYIKSIISELKYLVKSKLFSRMPGSAKDYWFTGKNSLNCEQIIEGNPIKLMTEFSRKHWKELCLRLGLNANKVELVTGESIENIEADNFIIFSNRIVWDVENLKGYLKHITIGLNRYDNNAKLVDPLFDGVIFEKNDLNFMRMYRKFGYDEEGRFNTSIILNMIDVSNFVKNIDKEDVEFIKKVQSILAAKGKPFHDSLSAELTPKQISMWLPWLHKKKYTDSMPIGLPHNIDRMIEKIKQEALFELAMWWSNLAQIQKNIWQKIGLDKNKLERTILGDNGYDDTCVMLLSYHLGTVLIKIYDNTNSLEKGNKSDIYEEKVIDIFDDNLEKMVENYFRPDSQVVDLFNLDSEI